MARAKIEKKLDIAKLQKMQEPITVQVYRLKGGNKIPVTLPSKIDGPPGTGWERNDVLELQNWIQNNAGGGFYEGEAIDANGVGMLWPFGWDPRSIPEKTPPASQPNSAAAVLPMPVAAPMPPVAPVPQVPMDPAQVAMAALGGGAGTGWLQGAGYNPYVGGIPPQPGQPQPQPQPLYGGAAAPWANPLMWPNFGGATPRNGTAPNTRERDLEQQLRQAQMSQQQATSQQQLDRVQMAHQGELTKMREEMRRLGETRQGGESDEVKLLREQLVQSQQKAEAQAQQAQFQQMMQQQAAATQLQMDSLKELIAKVAEGSSNKGESEQIRELKAEQRRSEERLERAEQDRRHREEMTAIRAEIAGSKQDPMLEYMRENSRQQIEAQKDMARNQRETTQNTTAMMVNPMQMMEMMQRQSGQSDAVTKQLIENFGSGFETYRMMMESLMQMQGGGQSPGMAMLSEGLSRAGEIANQYITAQRDKSVHESRAKATASQAQATTASAYQAQAEAAARAKPPSYDEQMRGPAEATAPPPDGQSGEPPQAEVINLDERRPPTEEEMFGHPEVMSAIVHLREGVASGKLDPGAAINSLLQGISMCEQQQIIVPAFTLFAEGRFADLMDALLPEAPQEFLDVCVQILVHQFNDNEEEPQPSG